MTINSSSSAPVILCCYINSTSKIQVARITNIANWYFERVVFPGQKLIFEASADANLEIHSGMMASSILSDTISCQRLVLEQESASAEMTAAEAQAVEYRNEGMRENQNQSDLMQSADGSRTDFASLSP